MQSYTEIPDSLSLTASRSKLLDNDKTVMSCHSGTAFPTSNLQNGMLCLRTDQMKLYQLRTQTPDPVWVFIADLDMQAPWGQFADLEEQALNDVDESGWYHQNTTANATTARNYPSTNAGLLRVFTDGVMTYQYYSVYNTNETFCRARFNGAWGVWRRQWDSVNLTDNNQLANGMGYQTKVDPELQSWRETHIEENAEAAYEIDCARANSFGLTLTADTVFTIINAPANKAFSIVLKLSQDATGNRVPTYPASVKWPGGVVPVMTPTAGRTDFAVLTTYDGGNSWFGSPGAKNYA